MKVKLKAEAIHRILARKNLSQNWLAQRIGTNSGYMSQMLAGKRNPSPEMRRKILDVLKDYKFDDLFTLQDQ
jgi:transcriptional regulator with XRE-family HTH domain